MEVPTRNMNIKQVKFINEDLIVGSDIIEGSKKRVTWTFSIGEDENAREHTVVLQWGKNSGKREVIDDGEYIYEEAKKGNFFNYKWKFESSFSNEDEDLNLHIIASSHTPPAERYCQFELVINGLQFSRLPHHDGRPLPERKGPGPFGIFDIVFPHGYEQTSPRKERSKSPKIRRRLSGKGASRLVSGLLVRPERQRRSGSRKSAYF